MRKFKLLFIGVFFAFFFVMPAYSHDDKDNRPIFISAINNQAATIAGSQSLTFNEVTDKTKGIQFVPGSGIFTLKNGGDYEITYAVRGVANSGTLFSILLNGLPATGGAIELPSTFSVWSSFSAIYSVLPNTTVQIVNTSLNHSSTLTLVNFQNSTNAYITIKELKMPKQVKKCKKD